MSKGKKPTSVVLRIMRRAHWEGDCLIFEGATLNSGYGQITANPSDGLDGWGRTVLVHRVIFQLTVRPLQEGEHVDHTCNNRMCVNRAHLEAVSQAENNRRVHERGRYVSRKGIRNGEHRELVA